MNNCQKIFAVVSILAGLVVSSVVIWAFIKHPTEQFVGERFVSDEISVVPYLGVYFKSITIIVIFGFISWASGLEALRDRAATLPVTVNRLLFVAFGLVAFVFGYEVIWNFSMWTAAHILDPNTSVDFLYNNLNPTMTEGRDFA